MKKAIIIGTSSGIGRALAQKLSADGYKVGLTGRFQDKLEALKKELKDESVTKVVDVRDCETAMKNVNDLINELGGLDLLVINAGVLLVNPNFEWERELETTQVNVVGFQAMANVAIKHFLKQNSGCLVGISSIASLRGGGRSPSYNASKAFMTNYLEGLRQKVSRTPIKVIDIRPGFVDTSMVRGRVGLFWVASCERAASDISKAIKKKKKIVYITSKWWIMAVFYKILPEWLYHLAYRKYISSSDYKDFPGEKG